MTLGLRKQPGKKKKHLMFLVDSKFNLSQQCTLTAMQISCLRGCISKSVGIRSRRVIFAPIFGMYETTSDLPGLFLGFPVQGRLTDLNRSSRERKMMRGLQDVTNLEGLTETGNFLDCRI